jgi:hypothetical protein
MALEDGPDGKPMHRLNGWRRLWLVATAGAAIWFVVVWPLTVPKDPQRHIWLQS